MHVMMVMRIANATRVKNILVPGQIVATARIAPKICQGQSQTFTHNVPFFIQIRSLLAEL